MSVGYEISNVITKTAAYTTEAGDFVLVDATGGPVTITVPANEPGARATIVKVDSSANVVTVSPASGEINTGGGAFAFIHLAVQGASLIVVADGTNLQAETPVLYGGSVTFANLTVGVGGVGLLEVTDDFQHTGDAIGFFGAAVHAKDAITGALSTVTDPAAKAVLTSILAMLTDYGLATNSTT